MKTLGLVLLGFVMTVAVAFMGYRFLLRPQSPLSSQSPISPQLTTVCHVPNEIREVYTVTTKNKKIKVNNFFSKNGSRTEILIKDDKIWSWIEGSTRGTVAKAEGKGLDKEVYDSLEKNKNLCLNGDAADFVFELPKEVIFK